MISAKPPYGKPPDPEKAGDMEVQNRLVLFLWQLS
jgi:hypothetical protein